MSILLTTAQLAERWACSPGALENDRAEGAPHPAYIRIRHKIRYRIEDVEAFEDSGLVAAVA
jgi:hypothetical protein